MQPKEPFVVVVTGAAGNVGSTLCFQLLDARPFKTDRPLLLRMVDLPETLGKMKGLKMEIDDCCFPSSPTVETWTEQPDAYRDADCVVLVGGRPRGPGMQRNDLLRANVSMFVDQARTVGAGKPKPDCKVVVVANPCNTNALFFACHATGISKRNITSMSLLDQMRAKAVVAEKLGLDAQSLKDVAVWGNHSDTLFVEFNDPELKSSDEWRFGELQTRTRQRGAEVIQAKGASSVYSAAKAAWQHLWSLYNGTAGEAVSMGVVSSHFGEELCVTVPVTVSESGELRPLFERIERLSKPEREAVERSVEELRGERRTALEWLQKGL